MKSITQFLFGKNSSSNKATLKTSDDNQVKDLQPIDTKLSAFDTIFGRYAVSKKTSDSSIFGDFQPIDTRLASHHGELKNTRFEDLNPAAIDKIIQSLTIDEVFSYKLVSYILTNNENEAPKHIITLKGPVYEDPLTSNPIQGSDYKISILSPSLPKLIQQAIDSNQDFSLSFIVFGDAEVIGHLNSIGQIVEAELSGLYNNSLEQSDYT